MRSVKLQELSGFWRVPSCLPRLLSINRLETEEEIDQARAGIVIKQISTVALFKKSEIEKSTDSLMLPYFTTLTLYMQR